MEAPVLAKRVYRFGLFQVDPQGGKLLRRGTSVKLQEQPFRVLCLLLESAGQIVTREQLRQSLWPEGTYVEFDGSLNATLKRLRSTLGDDADNPIFIETIPRKGYRFIAPVQCDSSADANGAPSAPAPQIQEVAKPAHPESLWKHWKWAAAGVALALLGVVAWRAPRRVQQPAQAPRKVIAVLPFSNQGAGSEFDYLRYAIPNDLVTDLTYAHSVSVRPFASTSALDSDLDPATIGTRLRVTHIVAGGFLLENKNLRVNIELIDVAKNQAIWREQVAAGPQELISLHDKLAAQTAEGLLPAMHISNISAAAVPAPKDERALDLFLHSLSISYDPKPNLIAIKKLEESVAINASYEPAWQQLAWRYYMDFHYGDGGSAAIAKSLEASKHQSELDPETPPVSITIHVEQGHLNAAYDEAAEFLRRRPDSSMAHFWMSYVYRYAGLLDEATKECDTGLALDPGFNLLRSCAFPSIMAGDYAHAEPYIRLDENFGAWARLRIALRTNNAPEVLKQSSEAVHYGFSRADDRVIFFQKCVNHAPEPELRKAAARIENDSVAVLDHELSYQAAEDLAFCGQADATIGAIRKAIQGNYCSYPAMDKDPLFDNIRQRPEFAELRRSGKQCQEDFLAHRRQSNPSTSAP
jgi:DNA-binding winged helix-turn-helix (wHTH) protein/TolB-like protein